MNTGKEKENIQVGRMKSKYQEGLKVEDRVDFFFFLLHDVTLFSKFCLCNPV